MQNEFNPDGYVQIIEKARFLGYDCGHVVSTKPNLDSPYLALRHDVDFSLGLALEMARIEQSIGVVATYYVMINSSFYNAFQRESIESIQSIQSLGHRVGLHWDSRKGHELEPLELQEMLLRESDLLGLAIGTEIDDFSQHEPTISPLVSLGPLSPRDAYSQLQEGGFRYVSDSSMAWRGRGILADLEDLVDIQFLSHPVWWMTKAPTREEKLSEFQALTEESLSLRLSKYREQVDYVLRNRNDLDDRFRTDRPA